MTAISLAQRTLAGPSPAPLVHVAVSAPTIAPVPPPPQPVVVITDLSAAGNNAAWRAGLVARDRGMPLQVLHVQSNPRSLVLAQSRVDALALELRQRLHINTGAQAVRGDLLREAAQAARDAGLLVIAATPGDAAQSWLFGHLAERLVRSGRTPVLAVRRRALTSYRRVLVPVELDPQACGLIAAAGSLSRNPRIKVLHVLRTDDKQAMWQTDLPPPRLRHERDKTAQQARDALAALIASAGAQHDGAVAVISFGPTARAVLEEAGRTGADLLVLGKRPQSALAGLLARGVTQPVLAATRADVLLVPQPHPAGSRRP